MRTRTNLDEQVLGSGTTARFVLLLILFTASSALMMGDNILLRWLLGDPNGIFGCLLASGWDPERPYGTNLAAIRGHNEQPLNECHAHYTPAWWAPIIVIVFLISVAIALWWWLPLWKGRRSRVIPLDEIDHRKDLALLLAKLVSVAGLHRPPRFVIDPAVATTSALAFGRPGNYTVCLHGGLVVRRNADPEGFRGVVLHELAHIRNGDVGVTYATIALWRVFLVMMLLPAVAGYVQFLFSGRFLRTESITWSLWPGIVPGITRAVVFSAFLVVLTYLSRADILRSREVYADFAAVRWGANPAGWHRGFRSGVIRGRIGKAFAPFVELWRTHPRWDLRKAYLTDPSDFFGRHALLAFLTGATALLVAEQLNFVPGIHLLGPTWEYRAGPFLAAGLITGIIGVALWRAVTHAVLTARRVPSGLRTGLWLGVGFVVGELLNSFADNQWLPSRPAVLLILILVAVVITCWTAQCAELWIQTWRGKISRPAALLVLVGMWIVLGFWISWWQTIGLLYLDAAELSDAEFLARVFPGTAVPHTVALPIIIQVFKAMSSFGPLIVWATTALWILPLLAWIIPSGTGSPRWMRSALPNVHHPVSLDGELPSLRRVLLAAVLGGVSSWVAVAAVMMYEHSSPVPVEQRDGLFTLIGEVWLVTALTAGPVAMAVVMGALATRHRLPVALVTAGGTALVVLASVFLLMAFGSGPSAAWSDTKQLTPLILGPSMFATVVAVLLVTGVANLTRRPTRQHRQPPTPERRIANRQGSLASRRVCVAVICVAALGIAATAQTVNAQPASPTQSGPPQQFVANPATVSPSPKVRTAQIFAWYWYGGEDLFGELQRIAGELSNIFRDLARFPDLDTALKDGNESVIRLRSTCANMERWTKKADAYFLIPDPAEQLIWSKALAQMKKGSTDCQDALAQRNSALFETSLDEMMAAANLTLAVFKWLHDQLADVK